MPRNPEAIASNQSAEKAFTILEYLAERTKPSRLIEISKALNMNASTTARFLSSLVNCGYVSQDDETQRYQITYKICRIANFVKHNNDGNMRDITHPYLELISDAFHESACVSVERDMQMVYTDVITGKGKSLLSFQQIGNTAPMHCTGNGKLCLLNYSEQEIDELILKRGLPKRTAHTLTNKADLMERLSQIRALGYACDEEEAEEGMRCLAYPLRNYTGKIIGGISVTGPAVRLTTEILLAKHHILENAAKEISLKLGAPEEELENG